MELIVKIRMDIKVRSIFLFCQGKEFSGVHVPVLIASFSDHMDLLHL